MIRAILFSTIAIFASSAFAAKTTKCAGMAKGAAAATKWKFNAEAPLPPKMDAKLNPKGIRVFDNVKIDFITGKISLGSEVPASVLKGPVIEGRAVVEHINGKATRIRMLAATGGNMVFERQRNDSQEELIEIRLLPDGRVDRVRAFMPVFVGPSSWDSGQRYFVEALAHFGKSELVVPWETSREHFYISSGKDQNLKPEAGGFKPFHGEYRFIYNSKGDLEQTLYAATGTANFVGNNQHWQFLENSKVAITHSVTETSLTIESPSHFRNFFEMSDLLGAVAGKPKQKTKAEIVSSADTIVLPKASPLKFSLIKTVVYTDEQGASHTKTKTIEYKRTNDPMVFRIKVDARDGYDLELKAQTLADGSQRLYAHEILNLNTQHNFNEAKDVEDFKTALIEIGLDHKFLKDEDWTKSNINSSLFHTSSTLYMGNILESMTKNAAPTWTMARAWHREELNGFVSGSNSRFDSETIAHVAGKFKIEDVRDYLLNAPGPKTAEIEKWLAPYGSRQDSLKWIEEQYHQQTLKFLTQKNGKETLAQKFGTETLYLVPKPQEVEFLDYFGVISKDARPVSTEVVAYLSPKGDLNEARRNLLAQYPKLKELSQQPLEQVVLERYAWTVITSFVNKKVDAETSYSDKEKQEMMTLLNMNSKAQVEAWLIEKFPSIAELANLSFQQVRENETNNAFLNRFWARKQKNHGDVYIFPVMN